VVSGKVTTFNRYPLQNLEVAAKKSRVTARTDSLGMFSIVCETRDVLKIRAEAFKPANIRVGPKTDTLKINLIFINNETNQQLATGYGYISKEDLTFAISHLGEENNDFCNYDNIFELIRGKMPGVTVDYSNSSGAVYIRGSSSLNLSSEALYVVDGITTNSIDHINPCDVRSLDVIKDGSAAIYGARGANGVVVIETRR